MPGRDWRDVVGARASGERVRPAAGAVPLPPALEALMEERRALERQMRQVTGMEDLDPRRAALYRVQPLAERRAEHADWTRARDAAGERAAAALRDLRAETTAGVAERLDGRPRAASPPEVPPLPLRRTPGESLRTAARRRPRRRETGDADAFLAARDALRDQTGSLARQSRDLDARRDRLRREGQGDAADAIDRALADTGADRILKGAEKLDGVLNRAATTADAPRRAGRVIENDWLARRDRIGGPDLARYERGFRERSARLLNVETGSVEQMTERMDRLRDNALDRRRAARDQERRDEARRERALARRRERDNE